MDKDFKKAIQAIKSKDFQQGGKLLKKVLRKDPNNELAWLWMSQAVRNNEDRRRCLTQVLKINPMNSTAKRGLEVLNKRVEQDVGETHRNLHTREGGVNEQTYSIGQAGLARSPKTVQRKKASSSTLKITPDRKRFPVVVVSLSLLVCIAIAVIIVLIPPVNNRLASMFLSKNGTTSVSSAVRAGEDLEIALDNGARVTISDGSLEDGTNVSLEIQNSANPNYYIPEGTIIGQVYDVQAENAVPDMGAVITLPIETSRLEGVDIKDVQLATYENGEWQILPSTVNIEDKTVSATVHHFSLKAWIARLSNKAPEVVTQVNPTIFANLEPVEHWNNNLQDLQIDVFVSDEDSSSLEVYYTYAIETSESVLIDEMNRFKEECGDHVLVESIIEGGAIGSIPAVQFTTSLAPPVTSAKLVADTWFRLPEIGNGHYSSSLEVSEIDVNYPEKIEIFVRVTDEVEGNPVNIKKEITVTSKDIPHAPELVSPGPTRQVVCPPQPTFQWWIPDSSNYYWESIRFRLIEGDDLWGAWFPKYDWKCGRKCDREGISRPHEQEWTPPEPLPNGEYTWGMAVSGDENEKKFKGEMIAYSNEFQFTVDDSLSGSECVVTEVQSISVVEELRSEGAEQDILVTEEVSQTEEGQQALEDEVVDDIAFEEQSSGESDDLTSSEKLNNNLTPEEMANNGSHEWTPSLNVLNSECEYLQNSTLAHDLWGVRFADGAAYLNIEGGEILYEKNQPNRYYKDLGGPLKFESYPYTMRILSLSMDGITITYSYGNSEQDSVDCYAISYLLNDD